MTEINNIPGFGYNPENNRIRHAKETVNLPEAEAIVRSVVPDLGVLGRSQIKGVKSADITRSVDEAVALAKGNPAILEACDKLYENIYQSKIKEGMTAAEAHEFALMAEGELLDIVASQGY